MDSIIALLLVYSMPDIGIIEHFYLSERYLYHTIPDYVYDPHDGNYSGSFYIDLLEDEEYYLDKDQKSRAFSGIVGGEMSIFKNNANWKVEKKEGTFFMNFPAMVESYTSIKSGDIHSEVYADIPLFRKYQERINFCRIPGIINSNAGKYNIRVLYEDYFGVAYNPETGSNEELRMTGFRLEKIEEVKVPADFFTRLTELPLVDIKTIDRRM